ncbi:MAG: 3-dehydro-L-gulonate 2-dehydrogenase [Chitinophagaceae bacterium]
MRIAYEDLKSEFKRVLISLSFTATKADLCAGIFAANSRDGVYSHGLNRFPTFVHHVKDGVVKPDAEPEVLKAMGSMETWKGNLAPGMYNATLAMDRAISLAKKNGIGCVAIKNTNHWMRGGTYGWQAAEAGCIGICFTNTIANMPPWGGKEARLGNNPMVIAVPRSGGHVVLDMAMSQFSYGKLHDLSSKGKELPVPGGYNVAGELTTVPSEIIESYRALPIGFWKGSGLSFVLDAMLTAMTGGKSVAEITKTTIESGVSQFFMCFYQSDFNKSLIDQMIDYTRTSPPAKEGDRVSYPGENTLATRVDNLKNGIPVNEEIWNKIKGL